MFVDKNNHTNVKLDLRLRSCPEAEDVADQMLLSPKMCIGAGRKSHNLRLAQLRKHEKSNNPDRVIRKLW